MKAKTPASLPSPARRKPGGAASAFAFVAVLMAQYTIVSMIVGLSVAGILRYVVTPQIVAKFEAIEAALKRLPSP